MLLSYTCKLIPSALENRENQNIIKNQIIQEEFSDTSMGWKKKEFMLKEWMQREHHQNQTREAKDSTCRPEIKYALSHKQNDTELYYNGIFKGHTSKKHVALLHCGYLQRMANGCSCLPYYSSENRKLCLMQHFSAK